MTENQQGILESENKKFRIRKLTEKECFRLMGVKDEDFENVKKNQTSGGLYHLAGDSIVTTCLMALFGEMLGIDYNKKIDEIESLYINDSSQIPITQDEEEQFFFFEF